MTGVDLMRAIRQDKPQLPVILATGFAELPTGNEIRTPILNKPFTEADLADVLKAVMP